MTELACDSAIRTIKLTGDLGRTFGRVHRLAVESPAEAVRALCTLLPGFRARLERAGAEFRVLVNRRPIGEDELKVQGGETYTFAPVTRGSKRGGLFQTILGAVLIVASFFVPVAGAALFNIGVAMVIGGVIQLLTPMPKTDDPAERPENKPNTQFSGPVNTQAQGHPVPIAYGQLVVGSAVISAGLTTGYIATGGSGGTGGGGFSPGGGTGFLQA